jgi:hypothetical protein
MKVSSECANLTVRMDFVSSGDNVYPTMNYVDIKTVLCPMFYKYDKLKNVFSFK